MGRAVVLSALSGDDWEGKHALFGLYEAIDAVKTMEPFTPNLMNVLAATLAQKKVPYSCNHQPTSSLTRQYQDRSLATVPGDHTPLTVAKLCPPHCRSPSRTHVDIPQLLNLLNRKVQRGFMLRPPSIHHEPMQRPLLCDNLVNGLRHACLVRHVGLQREEFPGMFLFDGRELVAGVADVDGVYLFGAVGEAAICYA